MILKLSGGLWYRQCGPPAGKDSKTEREYFVEGTTSTPEAVSRRRPPKDTEWKGDTPDKGPYPKPFTRERPAMKIRCAPPERRAHKAARGVHGRPPVCFAEQMLAAYFFSGQKLLDLGEIKVSGSYGQKVNFIIKRKGEYAL